MSLTIPVALCTIALIGGVSAYSSEVMRLRINSTLPRTEKFPWRSRNQWAVARKYRELFPESRLPLISSCAF